MRCIISPAKVPLYFCLCPVLLCAIVPAATQAAPYLKTNNYVQITDWNTGTAANVTPPDKYAATGPLYNDTGLVSYAGAEAQAKSRADYGVLGFYAYADPKGSNTSAAGWGGAMFYDTFTISKPSLNGQQGSLNVWVDITGRVVGSIAHPGVSAGASWGVQFLDDYYSRVESWDYSTNSGRQNYHGYINHTVSFVYGQAFDMAIVFDAGANNAGQVADYYNTMTMNMAGSLVRDASGNAVTDYTVTAASGHNYALPEPATIMVMALGGLVARKAGRR
jgi:hypothetical protein